MLKIIFFYIRSYYKPLYRLILFIFILISWFVFRFLGNLALSIIDNILFLFSIMYNIYKGHYHYHLIDSFLNSNNKFNQKIVLIELPRKNCWVVNFVIGKIDKKISSNIKNRYSQLKEIMI